MPVGCGDRNNPASNHSDDGYENGAIPSLLLAIPNFIRGFLATHGRRNTG